MIDLNTILNTALAEAVRTALAPLEERLRTLEQAVAAAQLLGEDLTEAMPWPQVQAVVNKTIDDRMHDLPERVRAIVADDATIDDMVNDRIETFLNNDDLLGRIDIEEAVKEAVEQCDLTETVRDLLSDARITI